MQNGCEEHRKGVKANYIIWPQSREVLVGRGMS